MEVDIGHLNISPDITMAEAEKHMNFVTDGKCLVIAVGRGAQASKNLARSVRERVKSQVKNLCFSVVVTTKKNCPQANCAVFESKSEFKK